MPTNNLQLPSDNLLVSLQKYASRPNYNPLENFITEAFAWLLRNNSDALNAFLKLIDTKYPLHFDFENQRLKRCETQFYLDSGIADLVLFFDPYAIVVEIKVRAGGRQEQVEQYKESLHRLGYPNVVSVFLSPGFSYQSENADVCLRWSEVYKALAEGAMDDRRLEFLGFLDSQGLAPGLDLDCAAFAYAPKVYSTFNNLTGLWKRIAGRLNQTNNHLFPRSFYHDAWGRQGIMFKRSDSKDADWNPALTIGVLYDPTDHGYEPITKDCGSVFMMTVDIGKSFFEQIRVSSKWQKFKDDVKKSCAETEGKLAGWRCFDSKEYHQEHGGQFNEWHPLAIYKPVTELLAFRPNKQLFYNTDEIEDIFEQKTKWLLETVSAMPSFIDVLDELNSENQNSM